MNPPLEYLVRNPKVPRTNPPLLLLLHGVGSNEKDLFSLADDLPESLLVISIRGPLVLGRDRFGWYEISFQGGSPKIDIGQQEVSQQKILEFLEYAKSQFQFDENNVWIGGFSQGAVMSYSVGLEHPDRFRGIIALSGRLLEETKQKIGTSYKTKKQNIYIAHGTNDNVISITAARSAKEFLELSGRAPNYQEYPEGHTISREILKDLVNWFVEQLQEM
ncbi:alpha/beta hydrolase [Leptospira limi]|uniref:Prolyl oligopeptidase family serine peptidase n=1 Tax=Leptospira limi TaxID=2950023 RepID=A0ABT3LTL8_9LEPT|nr:prolyl oligopeptidase family serine peptidase [Leptospira limi]MCW7461086.1 prolyl oligopeptidase family serine peptidase [Leptospira limi]